MANKKEIRTRIVHKHDIEANWLKATNFYPEKGEIIVYDIEVDDNGVLLDLTGTGRTQPYTYERFKIGDGKTVVSLLPFTVDNQIEQRIAELHASGEFNGAPGNDGYSPVREVDYWTDADKAEIKSYVDDAILNGAW